MQTLPLKEITINVRQRKELGDLTGLKDSISRLGLICPIVLDKDHNLIDGERRYRAHEQLGLDSIRFIYQEEATEDVKAEMEFEANYWAKRFTWQEECLGILDIYNKKKRLGALHGIEEHWHRIVSDMFGMSIGTINYVLNVARRLETETFLPLEKRKYWSYNSAAEAHRLGILGELQDKANLRLAELAKQRTNNEHQELHANSIIQEVAKISQSPDALAFERERYNSNPQNKEPFEAYWSNRQQEAERLKNTIYLSNRLIRGDCIDYMLLPENLERFDHIITDPPYAIDMEYLNQNNPHAGLVDLDRVEEAHQVDENLHLLSKFFNAAWKCTKEHAFVILCCDAMSWQFLYDTATKASFKVQRWPYIWRKVNQAVMNQCAGYNTTKDYEPVMICRKPSATLMEKRNTSFTDASNNEVTKLTGHPFAKPFDLTRDLLQMVSIKGQTILEPFAGGGSMVLQMLKMERNFVAVEKDERWFNTLSQNVKQHYLKLNPKFQFQ